MKDVPLRILVVDDEPTARITLTDILQLEGYAVTSAANGAEAIELLDVQPFDIAISDIRMPDINGIEVLRAFSRKQPDCHVILLTAYGALETAVAALREGGFDYLLKPANPAEVLAAVDRARVVLEEKQREQRLLDQIELTLNELKGGARPKEDGQRARIIAHAGILVDLDQHFASAFGDPLELTPTEFSILALLMRQPGRTFSSEEILRSVKGFSPIPTSAQAAIRVYISRLRQKIEVDAKRPRYLQTVRGVGYRFTP